MSEQTSYGIKIKGCRIKHANAWSLKQWRTIKASPAGDIFLKIYYNHHPASYKIKFSLHLLLLSRQRSRSEGIKNLIL